MNCNILAQEELIAQISQDMGVEPKEDVKEVLVFRFLEN